VAPVVCRVPVPATVVVPPTLARAITGPVALPGLTGAVPVTGPVGVTVAVPVAPVGLEVPPDLLPDLLPAGLLSAGLVDVPAGAGKLPALPPGAPAITGTAEGAGVFTVGSSERASSTLATGDRGVVGTAVGV